MMPAAEERAVDAMATEIAAREDREPLRTWKDDEWRPWTRVHVQPTLYDPEEATS